MPGRRLLVVAGLILLLAAGCAPKGAGTGPAPAGQAAQDYAPRTLLHHGEGGLQPLEDAAFQDMARQADYVLLGEGHAVACDHLVQARLLELLHDNAPPRRWTVGLEMLGADQQQRLDRINASPEAFLADEARLESELDWAANWGYGFSLYAPALQTALRLDMPLYALNVPKGLLRTMRREGRENMSPEDLAWLPEDIIPPMEEQKEALREVFSMHQEFMAGSAKDPAKLDERLERFFLVQSIWDTAMAERARELHERTGGPVAVLAGAGHVENGWGIAHRLRSMEPQARVLLVVPWRGGPPPKEGLGDVYFYCPESATTRQGLTLAWIPGDRVPEDITQEPEGGYALVEDVRPDSPAAAADLRPGDRILKAGGDRLGSLGGLHLAAVKATRANRPLQLLIQRSGYRLLLSFPLQGAKD